MLQTVVGMETSRSLEDVITVDEAQIRKAVQKAITAIKEELPEEALTHEVFKYVADRIVEKVSTAKLVL